MIIKPYEDPETGDLIIDIPNELIEELGWEVGDTIVYEPHEDGSIIVRKQND